jgi:two-component system, LytTR family, sensor histidine kinase AlgZ
MRYMIYDSNHGRVPLSKEVEYMQNYISLEKLRLNNQIQIDFNVHGHIEQAMVAPLILITFLENAFKHGVTNTSHNSWVKVDISVDGHSLVYRVENSKVTKQHNEGEKSGIGLRNVARRLELVYPKRHELIVKDDPERYYIELKLSLQ